MDSKTDNQKTYKSKEPGDIEALNHQLKDEPSAALHLQRVQLLQTELTEVLMICESLDWLAEHDQGIFDAAHTGLNEAITAQLGALPELNKTPDDDYADQASVHVQQLAPLADHFPIIHLSYGLLLMHQPNKRQSSGSRSPLDILEELLAEADEASDFPDQDSISRFQEARTHLQRAVQLMPQPDAKRGIALEALGQVCENLDDPVGAWQAYQQAANYERDFADKLTRLSRTINRTVRQRLLEHIDLLLKAGDLGEAAALLERCTPPEDAADFRIRAADLTFLQGDLDNAIAQYKDLMEQPR